MPQRALTRAAIFYGDRFQPICAAFRLSKTKLSDEGVMSPASASKLRRRFRGDPVERQVYERLVAFLEASVNDDIRARLAAKQLEISEVLAPACYKLTSRGVAAVARSNARLTKSLSLDGLTESQFRHLTSGGFAAEKHVLGVLRQLESGIVEDFYTMDDDDHKCYPVIYRHAIRAERQLELISR